MLKKIKADPAPPAGGAGSLCRGARRAPPPRPQPPRRRGPPPRREHFPCPDPKIFLAPWEATVQPSARRGPSPAKTAGLSAASSALCSHAALDIRHFARALLPRRAHCLPFHPRFAPAPRLISAVSPALFRPHRTRCPPLRHAVRRFARYTPFHPRFTPAPRPIYAVSPCPPRFSALARHV